LSHEGLWEREDLFDVLFGKDWPTGGDTAHQWDVDCLFRLNGVSIVGIGDFEGATLGGVFADKALFNECFDLKFTYVTRLKAEMYFYISFDHFDPVKPVVYSLGSMRISRRNSGKFL
jgi:hypothetical protein